MTEADVFRFLSKVLIVGVSSGFFLGIFAYLLLNRLTRWRDEVERSLEMFRVQLSQTRLRTLSVFAEIAPLAISSVYGTTLRHRLVASAVVGGMVTVVAGVFLLHLSGEITDQVRNEWRDVQRQADADLYAMFEEDDERLRRALEFELIRNSLLYTYDDQESRNIRSAILEYQGKLAAILNQHRDQRKLAVVRLFHGQLVDSGIDPFSMLQTAGPFSALFLFNLCLDALTVFFAASIITQFRKSVTVGAATVMLGQLLFVSAATYLIAYASYGTLLTGFSTNLVALFRLLYHAVGLLLAIGVMIYVIFFIHAWLGRIAAALVGIGLFWLAFDRLFRTPIIISIPHDIDIVYVGFRVGLARWDVIQAILAATTVIPVMLVMLAAMLSLAIKFLGDGTIELLQSHFGFVREEAGGSNIAAVVTLLAFVCGVIGAVLVP